MLITLVGYGSNDIMVDILRKISLSMQVKLYKINSFGKRVAHLYFYL